MSVAVRVRNRINNWIAQRLRARPINCRPARSLVSFSFDDFPRSAWRIGGEILCDANVHATYYVALGLVGHSGSGGPLFTLDDLSALVDAGHDVGCHTYLHEDGSHVSRQAFETSISRNRARLSELLPDCAFDTFSYPFGRVTPTTKRIVGQRFICGRGIRPGINVGRIDASHLRANSLLSLRKPLENPLRLIDYNAEQPGWLIFFTHDVCEQPSIHGCTPHYLATVIRAAVESGSDIVTMKEGMHRVSVGS